MLCFPPNVIRFKLFTIKSFAMKRIVTLLTLFLLAGISVFAQVGINDDNTPPDNSAMLDVKSTSRGFLPPRMTTIEMNSIIAPSQGLLVYNITVNSLFWFNGSSWKQFNEPYMETDPVFTAHPASGITTMNIGNWNAAYGWGNHAMAGYLTSYTETVPIFGAHPASGITVGNIGNWNAAYGWGNHASAGYLTSYTETDPIFGAHPASGITVGNITNWNSAYTNRIVSTAGTAPLTLSISGNQLAGSITAANSTTNGYLTSANWNTFNNKQNALTFGNATSGDLTITGGNGAIIGSGMTLSVNKGNLTEATSAVLTISGGTGSVLGSGVSVQVKQSGTSQSGYLSNTDWNTFNNKQSTLTFGNLTSSDITVTGGSSSVKGTGATLAINKGNLTSSDITVASGAGAVLGTGTALTINKGNLASSDLTITGGTGAVLGSGATLAVNKGNLAEATSSVLTIANGSNAVLGTGTSITVKQATTSQSGYLSNADWNTFNNKQSTLTFGNLTSSDITITGGSSAVKGTGATLAVNKGNLTSSDITVTGGSGSVLGTGTALTINKGDITSPDISITGGSNSILGTGTSLTINKGNLTESGSSVLTITGGGNSVVGTGTAIQVKQANTTQSGYLSNTDWNSFNNKVSSQWTANGLKLHYNIGNVGIGTSNPQSKVDIAGNAVIGSSYSGTNAAPVNGLLVEGKLGVGTPSPTASASFEVTSTSTGVLLPRMTRVQRNAIASPAEGLMVYCLNCGINGSLSIFTNGSWMTFSPCAIAAPAASSPVMSQGQIIWNWLAVSGAAGYKWNTTADYETAVDMNAAITKTETGTICGTTYTRYIWAYSSCGESALTALTATVPAAVPAAPVAATHVATQTSIVWNWNNVTDATGYKWNTTDDYGSAIDMGTATTRSETGVTCGTAYTRYVWAYNGCGYSISAALNQSTVACWACGISTLTINHVAGAVAPVTKTTTYGTVTNIPGELTKCWITSNLGSDHQANAVSDATEASAGWYWQFNRKQGYKHDGTTRTPNTTWISSIVETSDWITANDPCNIELGTTWHLPTYTEWYNVDNVGGWTTWTGPWGSGLKLHAAGYLDYSGGSLYGRGSYGYYWSSTQNDATNGWYLSFGSGFSDVYDNDLANGFAVRCVLDY